MQPGLSDTVAVEVDGMCAWWCEGTFSGAREIVRTAERAAAVGYVVSWGSSPRSWCAGRDTPREALAALHVYARNRTIVTRWPDSLFEWWREEFVHCCVDGRHDASSHHADSHDVAPDAPATATARARPVRQRGWFRRGRG